MDEIKSPERQRIYYKKRRGFWKRRQFWIMIIAAGIAILMALYLISSGLGGNREIE